MEEKENTQFITTVIDKINNRETAKSCEVYVDSSPPFTTANLNSRLVDGTKWMRKGERVEFIATDNGAGVKAIYYKINGNEWKKYEMPIVLEKENYSIEFYSEDNIGNIEARQYLNLSVDSSPPKIKILSPKKNNVSMLQEEKSCIFLEIQTIFS